MADKAFSTREAATAAGLTERQLLYWIQKQIILPRGKLASGSGFRMRYTEEDIQELSKISMLLNQDCPLQKIRIAITNLRKITGDHSPILHTTFEWTGVTILGSFTTEKGYLVSVDLLSTQLVLLHIRDSGHAVDSLPEAEL